MFNTYLLFLGDPKFDIIYETMVIYPLNDVNLINKHSNCIELSSFSTENELQVKFIDYFSKIGYYNTFSILPLMNDYELI